MGVIEQVIYFSLGSIVTALLALLFAPAFWSRALRLSRKQLQLQVPLSMQEILAERDHLRAAHAVERLRIEQESERIRATKDADLAAIGRYSVEAARLAEEVDAFRKLSEGQAHQIVLLETAVAEHKVESSTLRESLAAAHGNVEQLRFEATAAAHEHARLTNESEGHRSSAAALVDRLADHEALLAAVQRLEAEIAAVRAERDEERERQKTFHLGNSLKAEKDRAAERAAGERLDQLETENVGLKRALEALESADRTAGDPAGDDALRESIHALGLAVATMSRARRRPMPAAEPLVVKPEPRPIPGAEVPGAARVSDAT